LSQPVQDKGKSRPDLRLEILQKISVFLPEIVEDSPGQSVARLGDLENDDSPVCLGRSLSDQLLLQEGRCQTAGCALLQIEVVPQLGDRHGAFLDEDLEGVALAHGEFVTARPVPVPKLKNPDQFSQRFL
jgi:hypothetical protein